MNDPIIRAARVLQSAEALLITAGAGMGVDSGLPDFRGTEGFWNAYPPYRHLGLSFAQLANPDWFRRDPALAWGFYGHRLQLYRATVPHAGFAVLKQWAGRMPCGARVFTSNVDGHFQKARFAEEWVTEIHGSIHHLQCAGGCKDIWTADSVRVEVAPATCRAVGDLPKCPSCGGIARPNILMFGDGHWLPGRTQEQQRRLSGWLRDVKGRRLAVVECGAGMAIPTVRLFSELMAAREGATLIRINVREAEADTRAISIPTGAVEAILAIERGRAE